MENLEEKIGASIAAIRAIKGMSRINLAKEIGITHQQLAKNERGINRVSCSTLYKISRTLDVPIVTFFEDIESCDVGQIDRGAQELLSAYISLPEITKISIRHMVLSVKEALNRGKE